MNIIEKAYNWAYGATARKSTQMIILHHAAASVASPDDIHRWHLANGWRGIAYNFYVRKNGEIYRGREELAAGGHTTNYNGASIGVCFEGNLENETMSDAQRKAGAELVAYLTKKYGNIPVYKHSALNATACPGKNFPFDEIVSGPSPEPQDTDAEATDAPTPCHEEDCAWAVANGLFQGDGNGNFNWQGGMTREMFATVLHRFYTKFGGGA